MDLKIKNYVEKASKLEKQIEELIDLNVKTQKTVRILSECVSIENLEKKVSELENKQRTLEKFESIVRKLRAEIQPLNFLRELLEKKRMVTTPSSVAIRVKTNLKSSVVFTKPANCTYANQALDSSSDVNSGNSIMILSEHGIHSGKEVFKETDKGAANKKVMYDEALQMATSVNSTSVDLIESNMNIESIRLSPNCMVQSNSKDDLPKYNGNVCIIILYLLFLQLNNYYSLIFL